MKNIIATASVLYLTLCQQVYAAVPTYVAPSNNADQDNILEVIKGYFKDGSTIAVLALSFVGLVVLAWISIADINEARKGRKEWSDVGVTVIGGGAVYLFVSYLLATAAGVF